MARTKRKVYVATDGEYSDYHIVAVFGNRELAEQFGEVEEYEVYEEAPAKRSAWVIEAIPADAPEREYNHVAYPWDYAWATYSHGRPKVQVWEAGRGRVSIRVSGGDREQVRKAFRDRRARLLAEREGLA